MNTKQNFSVVERIARRSLMLVGFLVVALDLAGVGVAQSSAGTKTASPIPTPAVQPSNPLPTAVERAPKGTGEGIQVYGQWTIEVRNRDGSVAEHVEFENALTLAGQSLLALLLAGNSVPSGWVLSLSGNPSPCSTNTSSANLNENLLGCLVVPPGVGWGAGCAANLGPGTPQPYCYDTLVYSLAPTSGGSPVGLTLGGQAYADTTTNITAVTSFLFFCGSSSTTWTGSGNTYSPSSCFTNSEVLFFTSGFSAYSFGQAGSCGGSGQPLCEIYVQAGQIISASVQYTFSAPSSSSSDNAAKANLSPFKVMRLKPTSATSPTTK